MHIEASIRKRGGAAATHELHRDGFDVSALRSALRAGRIVRVRQGWYIEPGRHPSLVEAVRVGGRLTCGPALRLHNVWVFGDAGLHVAVPAGACQLRQPHDRFQRLDASSERDGSPLDRPSRITVSTGRRSDRGPDSTCSQCTAPELVAASAESAPPYPARPQHPSLGVRRDCTNACIALRFAPSMADRSQALSSSSASESLGAAFARSPRCRSRESGGSTSSSVTGSWSRSTAPSITSTPSIRGRPSPGCASERARVPRPALQSSARLRGCGKSSRQLVLAAVAALWTTCLTLASYQIKEISDARCRVRRASSRRIESEESP